MFACLFGFFLPFLDDERLYMRLGEESLSNVLRNVKLGRAPLGVWYFISRPSLSRCNDGFDHRILTYG